jgi:metallo-beta-lactamase family protein
MKLQFLGATDTVTGSKSILEIGESTVLVDCGMYQGVKGSEKRNREQLAYPAEQVDYIFLTHGHLDHCGLLPSFIKSGFKGKVICTEGTKKIVKLILDDAAKIQKYNLSKGKASEVLYDSVDVDLAMSYIETKEVGQVYKFGGFSFELFEAGHILGATSILFEKGGKRVCFSGDLGRKSDLIHLAPELPKNIDFLILESTYGDREHEDFDIDKLFN